MRTLFSLLVVAALAATLPVQASKFEQPWLGVQLVAAASGAGVKLVIPDTPADKAGVVGGDQIVAVGDIEVKTTNELIRAVGAHRVGDEVTVKVLRGDETLELAVVLANKPDHRTIVQRVLIDKPAPDFDLVVLSGTGSGRLGDYAGKVLVVEFFSVTCKYCPRTHKALAKLQKKYGDQGLAVVGIAGDSRQSLDTYLAPVAPKQTVVVASNGRRKVVRPPPHYGPLGFTALHDASGALRSDYWVSVFPSVAVIDRDGYVRLIRFGAGRATSEAVQAAVDLLDEAK